MEVRKASFTLFTPMLYIHTHGLWLYIHTHGSWLYIHTHGSWLYEDMSPLMRTGPGMGSSSQSGHGASSRSRSSSSRVEPAVPPVPPASS